MSVIPTFAKPKNPWLTHVEITRSQNPGLSYKEALKDAGKTYRPKKLREGALKQQTKETVRKMAKMQPLIKLI